jgi:hypothetical protein
MPGFTIRQQNDTVTGKRCFSVGSAFFKKADQRLDRQFGSDAVASRRRI